MLPALQTNSQIEKTKLLQYMPALTGIRAVAAYMVFLHHFNPFISFVNQPASFGYKLFSFCNEMHMGVTVFFVLSGFLISLRYQGTVLLSKKWLSNYALNRFARIFPMYALISAVTFIAYSIGNYYDYMGQYVDFSPFAKFVTVFLNFTLLKGFFDNLKFTGIAQGWSLTVEECFYFSAPFIMASGFAKFSKVILYVIACYAIGLVLTGLGTHLTFFGFFGSLNFLFCYTFFGRCLEFAIGIMLARLVQSNRQFAFKYFTLAGVAGIIFLIICMTYAKGDYEVSKLTTAGVVINNLFLPITISSLFVGLLREPSLLKKIMESKLFDLLGKSSYTFYLIHMGVIQIFISHYISDNGFMIFLILNVLSVMLFKIVEEPSHRYLKGLMTVKKIPL